MVPIIIPAFEPDERLIILLKELVANINTPIIIVNDGSGNKYNDIFKCAQPLVASVGGTILQHDVNYGKGRALKTAFSYILNNYDVVGVVTADSDGQHTPENIRNIICALEQNSHKLILGVRSFNSESVPWKSRIGNKLTEFAFKFVTGVHITDTQTGLRGIPVDFMRQLIDIKGERFEFEMRMLIDAAARLDIEELPITTIYDSKKNHQTHFNPLKDSIKIYIILFERFARFIISSVSSSIIDLSLFSIFCFCFKNIEFKWYVTISTILARLLSATYNYIINYKFVFNSTKSISNSAFSYGVLAGFQMLCSAVMATVFCNLFMQVPEVIIKIIIDTLLFFISYYLQTVIFFINRH